MRKGEGGSEHDVKERRRDGERGRRRKEVIKKQMKGREKD